MSGEAIYAALVSARGASASTTNSPSATATTAPMDHGGDEHGLDIYNALLAAAAARVQATAAPDSPSVSASPFLLEAHSNVVQLATLGSDTTSNTIGFFTDRFQALPTALTAVLGVMTILLALGTLGGGARAMLVGSQWGRERGTIKGKAHLGGGLGGVVFGGTAVGALAAVLILVIVGRQYNPSLGSYGTLAIVLCSSILGAILGGRFRWAARASCALLGSLSLTLLLTTSFRLSSLLPRLILLAISTTLSLLLSFLPRTIHSLSILSALTGAYLLILGIDLFIHLGFVDALGLLVARSGVSAEGEASSVVVLWGASGGKGLVAGWWLTAIVGGAWQWWLGGENGEVDETWNSYLSSFVTSHPSPLGTYLPPRSFLSRLFSSDKSAFTDIPTKRRRSPWDEDDEEKHGHGRETSDAWDSDLEGVGMREREVRKPAKYQAKVESDSEDEEEVIADVKKGLWSPSVRERDDEVGVGMQKMGGGATRPESVLSGSTMVGGSVGRSLMTRKESKAELSNSDDSDEDEGGKDVAPRASHQAEDDADEEAAHLVASMPSLPDHRRADKKSTFRSIFSRSSKPASYRGAAPPPTSALPSRSHAHNTTTLPISPSPSSPAPAFVAAPAPSPKHAVPATPSLINALHRVREAQRQARAAAPPPSPSSPRARVRVASGGSARKASYDEWWKEVVEKSGK